MSTTDIRKLPAHLQPWPEHWAPKEEYLAAISTPTHFYQVLKKIGDEKNTAGAALKRLVATGEATRNERNYYCVSGGEEEPEEEKPKAKSEPAPAGYTLAQISRALIAAGSSEELAAKVGGYLRNPETLPPRAEDVDEPVSTVSAAPLQTPVSTNPIQPETAAETAETDDDLPD